jgi:hypothetical protein
MNEFDTIFRWVQHTPVGELKALEYEKLEIIRSNLIKEIREVGRALEWIDGIVRIKRDEERQLEK